MTQKNTQNEDVNQTSEQQQPIQEPMAETPETDNMTQEEGEVSDNVAEVSADSQLAEMRDRFLRLQAEFDNYRKRTLKEKMELIQNGGSDVITSMLPICDDLTRAVEAMEKSDDIEALRQGVRLIDNKFGETLRAKGVEKMDGLVGQPFDDATQEAVARFAAGEDKSGLVIDVVQNGYMMGEKILRFAKVVVGE